MTSACASASASARASAGDSCNLKQWLGSPTGFRRDGLRPTSSTGSADRPGLTTCPGQRFKLCGSEGHGASHAEVSMGAAAGSCADPDLTAQD
eukprot:1321948-Rhodomonas_salina.1